MYIISFFNDSRNLFFDISKGARLTKTVFLLPITILVVVFGFLLSDFIIHPLLFKKEAINLYLTEIYYYGINFLCIAFFLWIWMKFYEKRSLWTVGMNKNNALKYFSSGFILGFLFISLLIAIFVLLGLVKELKFNTLLIYSSIPYLFLFLFGFVIHGSTEEILFRGWLFQLIGKKYKPWIGILVTSLLFSALHCANSGISFLAILNLVLYSILLATIVLYDKNIWRVCGWHAAFNWTLNCFWVINIGSDEGSISFFNIKIEGSDILSGGMAGPEGSIITTMLFFIILPIFLFIIKTHR
jgi:membrane protease YdiL (CAAX protease family)